MRFPEAALSWLVPSVGVRSQCAELLRLLCQTRARMYTARVIQRRGAVGAVLQALAQRPGDRSSPSRMASVGEMVVYRRLDEVTGVCDPRIPWRW